MPKLYHPDLRDVTVDVEDDHADRWVAQGWLKQAAEDAPKPGTKAALVEEAKRLGIPTEGTKDEIEARIVEHRAGGGTVVG